MPMLMSNRDRPAKLHYMAYSFRMLSPGDHVLCAVKGEKNRLDDLRYWSVEKQEPYDYAEISGQNTIKDKMGEMPAMDTGHLTQTPTFSARREYAPHQPPKTHRP